MTHRRLSPRLILAAALLVSTLTAQGQEPLWEMGIGFGGLQYPHYRGSAESEFIPLPIPYYIYRGDRLRADREGLRSLLFESDRFEINVSGDGAFPVNDNDNAREGMEDLAPLIEVGPSLNIALWQRNTDPRYLELRLPVRSAFSVDSGPRIDLEGWTFAPSLYWVDNEAGFSGQWRRTAAIGPIFADRDFHDYFYTVPEADARPDRPAYQSGSGYSGSRITLSSARRYDRLWVGGFFRYDNLKGAAFDDSPLVQRDHALLFGFGFSWVFAESERMVPRRR